MPFYFWCCTYYDNPPTERTKGPTVSMRWTPTRGPRDPWTPRGGWSVVEYLRPSTPAHRRRAGSLCASPYSLPSLLFSKQKRPPEQHFALRVAFLSFDVADVFCRRKEYGNVRCALTAGVKAMEMHAGRRPVYGGAPRHPPKIAANATTRGVQGSCGPLVGGRRIETAGRGA